MMKPRTIQRAIRKLNEEMDRFEKAVHGPLNAWFSRQHKKRCEQFDRDLAEIRSKCPHQAEPNGANFCRYCGDDLTENQAPAKAGI